MKSLILRILLLAILLVQNRNFGWTQCTECTDAQAKTPPRARRAAEGGDRENVNVEETYALLAEGEKVISPTNDSDVILVIGNTGAGKSTISLFLTGAHLVAFNVSRSSYIIKDVNPIPKISGKSTIISKTIFPELFTDPATGTSFYDCPGFSDTRSSTIEIVNSFFVKKVAEGAARVKILLVVTHNSLVPGANRQDFPLLLKHTTTLLRNMDVFLPSISLVATKVGLHYVEDEDILLDMAEFIAQAKEDLKSHGNVPVETLKLLDVLTARDAEGQLARLTFFRQPRKLGPLSENRIVQARKKHMQKIIFKNTEFVNTTKDDYGFSLSAEAIHNVALLTNTIQSSITFYFRNLSAQFSTLYNVGSTNKTSAFLQDVLELGGVRRRMNQLFPLFIQLQALDLHLTLDNSPASSNLKIFRSRKAFLLNLVSHLKFGGSSSASAQINSLLKAIETNANYLEFIDSFFTQSAGAAPFKAWLEPLLAFKSTTQRHLGDLSTRVAQDVLEAFVTSAEAVVEFFSGYFQKMETSQPFELKSRLENILNLYSKAKVFSNSAAHPLNETATEFVAKYLELLNEMDGDTYELMDAQSQLELTQKAEFLSFYRHAQESGSLEAQRDLSPAGGELLLKARWLTPLQTSLVNQSNFKTVETYLERNIETSLGGIKETLTNFYSLEFQGSEGGNIPNLKARLEGDLNWFKERLQVDTEDTDGSVALENTRKFVEPVLNRIKNEQREASELDTKLVTLGHALFCVDLLQSHTETWLTHNPLKWARNLQDFVDSLDKTVNEALTCSSSTGDASSAGPLGSVTIVSGIFVSLRQAVSSCWTDAVELEGQSSPGNRKLLIFSKHTVYVDAASKMGAIDLSIMAPNWVVKPGSQINVDGRDNDYVMDKASRIREQGRPGLPGGNAGSFLGVGMNFVGVGSLSVSARGGRGSRGQEGGNGRDGNNDAPIDLNRISYSFRPPFWWGPALPPPFKREAYISINITQCPYSQQKSSRKLCRVDAKDVTQYWCRGYFMRSVETEGGEGSVGGDGGQGGWGGQGGLINILRPTPSTYSHSNDSVTFDTRNSSGPRGLGGAGGRGGFGGQWFRALVQIDPENVDGKGRSHFLLQKKGAYRNGEDGRGSANEENIQPPHKLEPPSSTIHAYQEAYRNLYATFARDHLQDEFVGSSLSDFLPVFEQAD